MKNRKELKGTKTSFFHPLAILNQVQEAVRCDLAPLLSSCIGEERKFVIEKQLADFKKKFALPNSKEEKEKEALAFDSFDDLCTDLLRNTPCYPNPKQKLSPTTCDRDRVLLRARAICHQVLGELSEEDWFMGCRHSGGTSLGLKFTQVNIEDKWGYPLTSTERAVHAMERYFSWDRNCAHDVDEFNRRVGRYDRGRYRLVHGSRATTVDKNLDERRMIAVEPTVNMFLQQGLMSLMYSRMKDFGLDLESQQEVHRYLAYESSITGKNATIDWSKASDRVRADLVRFLFPPRWYSVLDQVRSPVMSLRDIWLDLPMISTMGNATTFPIETLVFWSIGIAVLMKKNSLALFPEWKYFKRMNVFGDDCIIDYTEADRFISICESVGFKVNIKKSYIDPSTRFRESCGGDFLSGRSVRIYYIGPPHNCKLSSLEPWLYTIFNGLLKKYISYFGTLTYLYDKQLLKLMVQLFREYKLRVKFVPMDFPDDSGLKMDADVSRLIGHYQRLPIDKHLRNRHGQVSFRYTRFIFSKRKARKNDRRPYRCDEFALWKNLKFSSDTTWSQYVDKRVGGYVVARGIKTFDLTPPKGLNGSVYT